MGLNSEARSAPLRALDQNELRPLFFLIAPVGVRRASGAFDRIPPVRGYPKRC